MFFDTRIDADVIDAAGTQLKVISTHSVGYNHVDVEEVKRRGIRIGYTPDVVTDATAEITVALVLMAMRRLVQGVDIVRHDQWRSWTPQWMLGNQLTNKTVGIVGLGRIGQAVARRLLPFGIDRILYTATNKKDTQLETELHATYAPLAEVLAQSDVVIALCVLNDATRHIFNEQAFRRMHKHAVFVNAARGGLVDEQALVNALQLGWIKAAALDVTEHEPLSVNSPLLTLPNCIVLPHLGTSTQESRDNMGFMAIQNAVAGMKGDLMPAEIQ